MLEALPGAPGAAVSAGPEVPEVPTAMKQLPLDVTKSLYDSDGYRHTLVTATPVQIVTLLEGFYWLWDRVTGRCLLEGMGHARLSNHVPSGDDAQARRNPVAETRAFLTAQSLIRHAASGRRDIDDTPAGPQDVAH
jgi:hypothetical protein